jgi:hypothetical protein
MKKPLLVAALVCSVTACEKAAPSSHGSGAMTKRESDLLAHLPSGANIVFGGSLYGMQKRMQESAIGKLSAQMNPPEMTKWNDCLAAKNIDMAGTLTVNGGELSVRVFMKGVNVVDLDTCAKQAGLPSALDADGKVVTIDGKSQGLDVRMPYLAVDGGVYGVVSVGDLGAAALGGKPSVRTLSRADLEREAAALPTDNAAGDARLAKLLPKIDRRKMIWFAGTAEGTPIADKVVLGYGSFSIEHGMQIDVTIQPASAADADRALSGFHEMKSHLDQIPPGMAALKDAVRAIKVDKVADGVRVQLALSDDQIEAVMQAVAPMMPARP